jgi:two-component system nitrate/nitrite response regulator NarL
MSDGVRILIVDDHTLFRESVARPLVQEAGMVVAGICGTLVEAKGLLDTATVDVVLLDFDLGSELGIDLLEFVAKQHPRTRVLLLTGGVSAAVTRRSVQAGVAGVVLKHSSPQQLIEAVRVVADGGGWWDASVVAALTAPSPEPQPLSERQSSILNLLLEGHSNKELAVQLQISETAVKASLQELFRKTGVRTRSQLVRIAVESRIESGFALDKRR